MVTPTNVAGIPLRKRLAHNLLNLGHADTDLSLINVTVNVSYSDVTEFSGVATDALDAEAAGLESGRVDD